MADDTQEEIHKKEIIKVAYRLSDLYVNNFDKYNMVTKDGVMFAPKSKQGFTKLTQRAIVGHVFEGYAICIFAGKESSKFMCLDVDLQDTDVLDLIIAKMQEAGVDRNLIYVSTSGNKGYHIEIFFSNVVKTEKLKKFYKWIIWKTGLSPVKVEFRPTNTQSIKLPLSIHAKTGNVCWYLDNTYHPIEDKKYIFQIETIPRDVILSIIEALETPPEQEVYRNNIVTIASMDFPQIIEKGTRHKLMLSIALYLHNLGYDQDYIGNALEQWYIKQDTSLVESTVSEVESDMCTIINWVSAQNISLPGNSQEEKRITKILFEDIVFMLSLRKKNERRVWFYINAWCRRFGHCKSSMNRIAYALGLCEMTVCTIIEGLIKNGFIDRKYGKCTITDNGYRTESNIYYIKRGAPVQEQMWHIYSKKKQDFFEIDAYDMNNEFDKLYSSALLAFLPRQTVENMTVKGELIYDC
jgi:hypothetical protein